jgi:hypothetical protein
MSSTGAKQYKEIFSALDDQGWTVEQTNRGHFKAVPPDKTKPIIVISMSDDPHAYMNNIRDLKRGGFIWPVPSKAEARSRQEPRAADNDAAAAPPSPPSSEQLSVHADLEAVRRALIEEDEARTETLEQRMDRLFKELKDARVYATLTEDQVKECKRRVEEATLALAAASREHDAASTALVKKKVEFDEAFSQSAAA